VLRWRMGSVKLDFAKARIVHPVVEIELDVSGGSVEIRLPEGASASLDGVEARLGRSRTTGGAHLPRGGLISS